MSRRQLQAISQGVVNQSRLIGDDGLVRIVREKNKAGTKQAGDIRLELSKENHHNVQTTGDATILGDGDHQPKTKAKVARPANIRSALTPTKKKSDVSKSEASFSLPQGNDSISSDDALAWMTCSN